MAVSAVAEVPPEPVQAYDGKTEATRSVDELFHWSTYVHGGAGAAECPDGENGACSNAEHFHAWLRLPNTFQARDISEKANASRARRRRQLREEGTDAQVSLEDWLDNWLEDDETYNALIVRIANRIVLDRQLDIRNDLAETDEFEHYPADLEEFQRLSGLEEGDRDPEEYKRLAEHVDRYVAAFEKQTLRMHEEEVHRLTQMARADVLAIERRDRIKELADQRFVDTFYLWAYFICALKPVRKGFPASRVYGSLEELKAAPSEITDTLRDAYRRLEGQTVSRGDVSGNS